MSRNDFFSLFTVLALLASPASAQKKKQSDSGSRETVAKPMSEKEIRRQQERLKKELETPYKKWLNEDVLYIITDEEKKAFKNLTTDEERESYIEQFWLRRDPSPDTQENEYKEEHYRRIAYANERFASGIPGWKTDRGMIYITFGPADEVESHPSGGTYERPWEEGGGTTSTFPFEKWRYRYLANVGMQTDIIIEFVDKTMTGEYRMTMDPSEKDALLMVPGAGLTMMEQMGMADKADRFSRTDGTRLGVGTQPMGARMNQFERLQQYADLQKAPQIKFKDLEAQVNSRILYNLLPMQARADFFPATSSTVMSNITLQFNRKDLQFKADGEMSKSVVNIYARITSMARRVVNVFEDVVTIDVPTAMLQQVSQGASIYQKSIPLPPGMYRINVVAKDVIGGNTNNYEMALNVPRMEEDKLFASTLILADLIEKVPTKDIGMGQFVIGTSKVRPRMGESFARNEKMGIYMKLYNFQPAEKSNKPDGTVEYEIVRTSDNSRVLEFAEDANGLEGSASQLTIEKLLPLANMEPGQYTLRVKVTDKLKNSTLTQSAQFSIK
ncbi:MAG: GWxTD domain-containing protein [Acidobacteria bacterium]|nr:GWxTD domain-containing protein [Acidobacteriota bacterium]